MQQPNNLYLDEIQKFSKTSGEINFQKSLFDSLSPGDLTCSFKVNYSKKLLMQISNLIQRGLFLLLIYMYSLRKIENSDIRNIMGQIRGRHGDICERNKRYNEANFIIEISSTSSNYL